MNAYYFSFVPIYFWPGTFSIAAVNLPAAGTAMLAVQNDTIVRDDVAYRNKALTEIDRIDT